MPSPIHKTILRSPRVALTFTAVVLLVLAPIIAVVIYQRQSVASEKINYSQLYSIAENTSTALVTIEGDVLTVRAKDGSLLQATVTSEIARQGVVELFRKSKVPIEFQALRPGLLTTAFSWSIPILTFALVGFIGWRAYSSMSGRDGSFKCTDTSNKQNVTFAEVAGVDEAKAELGETIEFLRNPARFGRLGGRAPRGILLAGLPGTGKTLLARAAANEAAVPFLSVSGASFQEKFAGVGAARVRRLFAKARKISPCIVFIDEIDAVGRRGGRSSASASADQDQPRSQLLIEMDGFDQSSSIVVIASTNRPDILDQALTRPGRFDRRITVNLADARGREAILRVHARGLHLEPELDLQWIARGTPGFSGAELANLMNEAAITAIRDDSEAIGRKHIEAARDRILMGAEREGFRMDEDERHATAVHEAGHVAVGLAAKHGDPIHKVSILPRGGALGVTQSLPDRDRLMKKCEYLEDQIATLLGGRAAEQILLSTMTAGASNDIERAVEIARRMVSEFGMSPLGPIHLGASDIPHSQTLLDRIEDATAAIITEQLKRACDVVRTEEKAIARLVSLLLERDTVDSAEILECFAKHDVPRAA